MGNGSAVAESKPDTYPTSQGMKRIRLKPRPAVIPRAPFFYFWQLGALTSRA